jgi:hypothetical protein
MQRREHIVIAEQKILGRPLERGEVVHHKDHNPINNSIDNLEIMTRSEHSKEHHFGRWNKGNRKWSFDEAIKLRKAGLSAAKIAKTLKIPRGTLSVYFWQNKIYRGTAISS